MARYICTHDCFDQRGVRREPGDIVDYAEGEHVPKWFAPVATNGAVEEAKVNPVAKQQPETLFEMQMATQAQPEATLDAVQEKPSVKKAVKAKAKAKSTSSKTAKR